MCSQIDKPLRFQEIGRIEEDITLVHREVQFVFIARRRRFAQGNVIERGWTPMANFRPFPLPCSYLEIGICRRHCDSGTHMTPVA